MSKYEMLLKQAAEAGVEVYSSPMTAHDGLYMDDVILINSALKTEAQKACILAEELAQETFYKAIVKINTFREDSKISTWLCKIAQNLWYDEIRKHKKNTLNMEEVAFLISDEDIEHKLISNEEKDILNSKIDSLDLMTKKVIELRIHGNLKFKDIGAILGKTENWARVTFYRGKIKLKEGDCDEK